MKITGETKIKELIPEGYEMHNSYLEGEVLSSQITLRIGIKSKKKDFNWYLHEYHYKVLNNHEYSVSIIQNFKIKNYDNIPFEYRIGLLKFICDELRYSWMGFINNLANKNHLDREIKLTFDYPKLKILLSKEFLDSLTK